MRASSLILLGIAAGAAGQAPDVTIKGDLTFGLVSGKESPVGVRLVSPLGRFSTISLSTLTAEGLTVKVSQRMTIIPGDVDNELFDEYYIEDPGSWRIGKQYLPFAGQFLLRESVLSVRLETSLIFEGLPLTVAFADAGASRQYGFLARLGASGLGFSFASGSHWGINGTALAPARGVDGGLGRGNGFARVFGFDWNRRFGKFQARYEAITLAGSEVGGENVQLDDFGIQYDLGHRHSVAVGWTQGFRETPEIFRIGGTYNAKKGFAGEFLLRTFQGEILDLAFMLRVRF